MMLRGCNFPGSLGLFWVGVALAVGAASCSAPGAVSSGSPTTGQGAAGSPAPALTGSPAGATTSPVPSASSPSAAATPVAVNWSANNTWCLAGSGCAAPPQAALDQGKTIFQERIGSLPYGCAQCHGLDGRGGASAPENRGKSASVIKQALADAEDMGVVKAQNLTDAQIEAVAAYLQVLAAQPQESLT